MTQVVTLVPYNPEWEEMFNVDKMKLYGVLGNLFLEIEHVGSTSIPGMCAKPIIDIAIAVNDFSVIDEVVIEELTRVGYEYVPKKDFPQRKFFRRGQWGAGTHHLHMFEKDSDEWVNMILFRNYLRTHSDVANDYLLQKKQLARKHERIAYTKHKAPFIEGIIKEARKKI
ncbi:MULTISPECIES: GrpB family protein [Bacillus]|nr:MULTISPECIES: GrpB family protein [Bacillus]MBP1080524.1 GrpB-like predicted nucleotidyltransferase (UPF0157 family) [Bacillus capparidis]MED1094381.1 GrpB family protein [Bacillus capparidis]